MSVQTLLVSREIIDFMADDCRMRSPEEACGLLIGQTGGNIARIYDVMPVRNESMSPVRFSIDPVVMFKAMKKAEERGQDLLGVYHSHPRGGEPSCSDVTYMEGTSYVWVIVEMCHDIVAYVYDGVVRAVKVEKMEEPAAVVTSRGSV